MESISTEITDTPITTENVSSISEICWSILLDFLIHCYSHLLFGYSLFQTSFDETFAPEQEHGSSPIGNDPTDLGNNLVVSVQTIDPPIRHTPDGKETIRLFHHEDRELKISPVIVDANAGSLEPTQLDVIGASSAAPSPLTEAAIEKLPYPLCCSLCDKPSQAF